VLSDGTKLTADDVVFSFKTVMNPDVDCEPLRGYYERVKTCTKIDDHTVEFIMAEPYFRAMDFVGGLTIIPEHVYKFDKGEEFNKRIDLLVGSGAYKLEPGGWVKGQKIVFVRNEKYWGDRPTFDRMQFVFIGNPQSQVEAFMKEEVDELSEPIEPDPEDYLHYSNDADFLKKFIAYKYARPNAMSLYVGYNLRKPMFKDKETRQALTMLIDRKGIINELDRGFGVEMTGPFNAMGKANDPSIKPCRLIPKPARKSWPKPAGSRVRTEYWRVMA